MRRSTSAFAPEALLAHREWIERAARVLVIGEADAEDLAQQVWVDVLSHPPAREPTQLRRWLRSVLRFKAIDSWRATEARRRNEGAAGRRERIDTDPAAILARAEELDRVAHAVFDLEDPYRTTVLLRWFEDLTPREIAARQRIPVETVRTRLKRAVALLRARLDAENGGDRRAWCVALLPLLRPSPKRATSASSFAATALGVLSMGTKTKVVTAAAILALLVGGGLFWRTYGGGNPAILLGLLRPSSHPERIRVRRVTETPDAALHENDAAVGATVTVRVESPGGDPIDGALVNVAPARTGTQATWCPDPVFVSATTDNIGRADLVLSVAEATQAREVRVTCKGYVAERRRTNATELTVQLRRAAVIRGRVYDADTGRPLAGIPIGVGRTMALLSNDVASVTSDQEGRFDFATLAPGVYSLKVRSPEWLDVDMPYLRLDAERERVVEIGLHRGEQLAGVVKDAASGEPIEDGRVVFYVNPNFGAPKVAHLREGGAFTLRGISKSATSYAHQSLRLEAEGYEQALTVEAVPVYDRSGFQTRAAALRARPGASLRGRVVRPDGTGVPDALVAIGTLDTLSAIEDMDTRGDRAAYRLSRVKRTVSGVDGSFRMGAGGLFRASGNLATERRILVVHPDFGVYYRTVSMEDLGRPFDVQLEPGIRLDVEVLDESGSPEPGAEVWVELRDSLDSPVLGPDHGNPFAAFRGAILSDSRGHASVPGLGDGEWIVHARSSDGGRAAANLVSLDGEGTYSCRVTLEDALAVTGTVVDDETGAPLVGAVVALGGGVSMQWRRATTDGAGRFEFRCVEIDRGALDGLRLIVLEVPGAALYLPAKATGVQPGDTVALRAKCCVRETREISGRVLDATTGAPVVSGLIKCSWRDAGDPNATQGGMDSRFNGGVFVRQVPAVEGLHLTFWADGFEQRRMGVEELEEAGYDVRLAPKSPNSSYGLRVRVIGGDHPNPAVRSQTAWVYIYDSETKRQRGRWTTGMLPEFVLRETSLGRTGRGLIELQVPGWYQPEPAEFVVEPGAEADITINLVEGGGTLGGACDASAGAEIELTYPSGVTRTLSVTQDGKWWAGALRPGTYTLTLEGAEPVVITLGDGDRAQVDLGRSQGR